MTVFKDAGLPAVFRQLPIDQNKASVGLFFAVLQDLIRALDEESQNLKSILNRGLSFDDNVDCRRVSVTSHGTPGTEFSVAHLLGKIPTGYIVYGQDGAGSVYDGATANSSTTLYLKSDVASKVFRLIVF